ncbi:4Fe-4S cluster-binding domain-containing protein [Desulfovibrio oxyclinae]|uniref:4Fe-4S cluster-binding domain-containing protein n=1 Tax=Desulfovibrio oxyclinae TaxID=63560 RepID=UPI00146139A2|nr:4Fe-4S cluster-binding domain-containing protein [Desulfovibrio oxyclinae]
MNILATEYSLRHKALELYVAGCKGPHCPGCHNPETWSFDQGVPFDTVTKREIETKIKDFAHMIDNIWVLGGEPIDQDRKALEELLSFLRGFRPVWLFTRYELSEVSENILCHCSYVKTGRYNEDKLVDDNVQHGVKLASSNQKIHRLNN